MSLLNPPELRASMMCIIVLYLAQQRGQQDKESHIIDAISPRSLTKEPQKHQNDAHHNLKSAIDLGLATQKDGRIKLSQESTATARQGSSGIATLLRKRILSSEQNTAPWGSQDGARDLTNALAWFLTFSAVDAPSRWEGIPSSVASQQERDFGPRESEDSESGGGPIANDTRWTAFQRWTCSLGFAWRSPSGRMIPDPTRAIRDSIPAIFNGEATLDGLSFVEALETQLPVLEGGAYRRFVDKHRQPSTDSSDKLSAATTDALYRLEATGHLQFENRADASKVRRHDDTMFSHASNLKRR